jgi:alpha-L-rhamnosidase
MPWTIWRAYGDTGSAAKAYPGVRRYLDARDRRAKDDLDTGWSFGDWVSPPPQTPNEVLGPIYHAWMHRLAAELAAGIGKTAEAAHHRARFATIRAAWRKANLDADGRCRTSDTQAAYACGLRAGVVEPAEVAAHFVRSVERHGWHLNTGFLGTYCLLPALSQIGRDDVAWRVLLKETYPGWLYTVLNGATTMWERWDSYSPQTGPVNIGNMNSYNHYAFGAVGEWMYANIAGIERTDDDIAFQRLVIRPVPGGCCKHARGEYRGVRGTVRSAWWIEHMTFRLEVEVPPNCTAEVHVPARPGAEIACDGARQVRPGVFAVGAGRWTFSAPA